MALRHAITNHELEVHYQPIVNARTLKVAAAEALLRWRHPIRGLLLPELFLPVAEETGLIAQIGRWVLENACKQAAAWPSHITLAVNLSPVQFRRPSFQAVVTTALKESRLPPQRLELEITETALLGSSLEYLPVLRKLKDLGIAIALDDFGTGHSSLSQLTMFPFDKIKIDKAFIGNMAERTDCGAIIDATLTMAKRLGMATTAEGVETTEQLRLLRAAGVTSMQGYLFAQPTPAGHVDLGAEYERLAEEVASSS